MDKLVSFKNISYEAYGKDILKDITFDINRGDFITIVGPNGSGKSTVLKILLGNIKKYQGKISKFSNLKIGYMPQKILVDHTIPVSVEYFLKLYNDIDTKIFEKTILDVGIENLLQRQLYVLSGGEMQRVLLAKALLSNPDLLVLDEPAQNLDISAQLEFYSLLNKIYKQNRVTILMVSHDLHMVMSSTKQVICLYHHICCSGEPHVVTKNPEFISIFGKDMSKLMSIYNHYHNHDHG